MLYSIILICFIDCKEEEEESRRVNSKVSYSKSLCTTSAFYFIYTFHFPNSEIKDGLCTISLQNCNSRVTGILYDSIYILSLHTCSSPLDNFKAVMFGRDYIGSLFDHLVFSI